MMRFILQRCPACLLERTIDKLDSPDLPKAVARVEERCSNCEPDGYEEWFDAEGGRIATSASPTDNAPRAIYTVHLWDEPGSECGICEEFGPHRHAVGWYCEPVKQSPGEPVPEWGPDAIAGGRIVCKTCHDSFYGLESAL